MSKVLPVQNVSAPRLVRALVQQEGHLAADACANRMLIVDTFANVQRIQKIVGSMDQGEPLKGHNCSGPPTPPPPARTREGG